jgi:hypothetical protein
MKRQLVLELVTALRIAGRIGHDDLIMGNLPSGSRYIAVAHDNKVDDIAEALKAEINGAQPCEASLGGHIGLLDSLNELSKPEAVYDDKTIRRAVWEAVGRLRDAEGLATRAEGLVASLLNHQEGLPEDLRNPALVEKCKKFLGEK